MIITVTKSAYVHRRIFSLLCMLLIFIAILPISAFADWVTVSTVNSASYFQTFSSKGVWTAIGTPAHYINETGQVAYCLQTNYNSPNNSGYSSTSGWQYYDETTIRGLQSILEHGYPNDDGGFSADEARYATANAIRFWLAERGAEGVPAWMNLQLYSQFFRGASGYEYLFQWCMYLLENARYQVTYSHSVSFSPITLTEDGDYYVGTTTVTLVNCTGGYTLDRSGLPSDAEVYGWTGNDGDVLTIRIPKIYGGAAFTLNATGIDNQTDASLIFFNPDNWGEQRILAYTYDIEKDVANASVEVVTPEPELPKTAGLAIRKVDADTGAAMPGVTFALYNSAGETVAYGTTGEDGYVYFTNMPLGDYYYEEINTLDGYVLDNTRYSVSLVSGGQTVEVTMTNSRFRAKLVIVKQDGETKTPLSGAGFRLFNASGEIVGEGYTDENGQITFENLKKGSYTYQEYEAPRGYALDDTVYPLDITEHGKTITVMVDNTAIQPERDGSITVTKESTDGSILTGAEYLLEYSTDNGVSWQPVFSRTSDSIEAGGCTSSVLNNGRLTVNSAGTATFSGLKADRSIIYKLTETRAPDGCTLLAEPLYTGALPVKVDKSFSSDDCEVIDGENYCYVLYVTAVNGAMYRLPNTGGSGFAYIPIVLCILGAVLYAFTITHDTKSNDKKEKSTHE